MLAAIAKTAAKQAARIQVNPDDSKDLIDRLQKAFDLVRGSRHFLPENNGD